MTDAHLESESTGSPMPGVADEELGARVEDAVNSLLKAARAKQIYVPENPLVARFRDELCDVLRSLWDEAPHLTLAVDEGRLMWGEREVYSKPVGPDNFAFRFFKDGIRLLAFLPGVEETEIEEFLEVLRRSRVSQNEDLLANLWHQDFQAIQLEYVDLAEDEQPRMPEPDRNAGAGENLEDMSEITAVLESGPVTEDDVAEFSDVALGEPDLMYLRREMDAEWARPVVHDVTLALLDQFEMRDQERRRQVVDILRELLPRLLSQNDFGNVALIVNELQLLANKTGENETQELVTSLLRDMSEAMAEMVSAGLEDSAGSEELASLVGALQAEAIPTLVRAIPAVPNRQTREQLAAALDRLVSGNPGYVVDLLTAEDPMLAAEAARIIGRLGLADAEPELIELARRPEDVTRQAAIEALALLGSESSIGVLKDALADRSREIRLSALEAIASVKPADTKALLESSITGADMAGRSQSEQMAFFKAYAAVAGDSGVSALARLLNGRKWWGARREPVLRANAARALGIIGSEQAKKELQRAAGDRAVPVKNAVRVALKNLDSDSGDRMRAAESEADFEAGDADPTEGEVDTGPVETDEREGVE